MLPFLFSILLPLGTAIFVRKRWRPNFAIDQVIQCEPVSIKFDCDTTGITPPVILTIFPFASTPLAFHIPSITLNSTVVKITFLPLQAGERLIASLSDEGGELLTELSDVISVMPSPTGDETCLENASPPLNLAQGYFNLISTPSQCEDIAVAYHTGIIKSAPTVYALMPNGSSLTLPQISDNHNGTATYLVNIQSGLQVLFLFDDGLDHLETTSLITVSGDAISNKDCLPEASMTGDDVTPESPNNDRKPIPKALIIGTSIGGGVTLMIALLMVVFIVRDRRRRRRRTIDTFISQRSFGNTRPPSELAITERAVSGDPMESRGANTPYVIGKWEMKNDADDTPTSRRSSFSWSNDDKPDTGDVSMLRRPSVDPVATFDIEGILSMATSWSGSHMCKQDAGSQAATPRALYFRESHSISFSSESEEIGYPRRRWQEAPDVPADFTASATFSAYSLIDPHRLSKAPDVELPSPFMREDEPACTASDIIRSGSARREEGTNRDSFSQRRGGRGDEG